MPVSFIVPVKNGLSYTRALVETVERTNPDAQIEWIIVDSGSTDGTLEWCADIGARVVPFRSEPFNYCAAVNAGAERATGDLWIISNNDIEWRSEGDLERVRRIFREWPLVAVLSPGRASGAAELEFLHGGINGASWAVRPEAFRSWGGMPETMSGYGYDEAYTAFQCWRRGYGNAWLTGWNVFHHGSITFGPDAGNITPALRRNLSRLLALMDSSDLDARGDPWGILDRLWQRELDRAPCRLLVSGGSRKWLHRQGYANAKLTGSAVGADPLIATVMHAGQGLEERQWVPWLQNELLLQPRAAAVGKGDWLAMRLGDFARPLAEFSAAAEKARSVGPEPQPLMPPLPSMRPTLVQRLRGAVHAWRNRNVPLPEEW